MPGLMQAWPTVAACWSPAMPKTGTGAPRMSAVATPSSPEQSTTLGRSGAGTPSSFKRPSSQVPLWMSSSRLRLALVASLACTLPPVRRHSRKHSMVPAASAPFSAAARLPATWSRIQAILVPEKYGSRIRPVFAVTSPSWPARFSASQRSAVRRSCQTMALWIGLPVLRSHTTVVSRWLVIPMPASALASSLALASAPRQTSTVARQISSASCSTQPGLGKICGSSFCALATGRPVASNTMARVLVVPWSMARMCLAAILRS